MIDQLRAQTDAIIVEIHAEATSEKQAMGWYLDGRVTAVLGTHTTQSGAGSPTAFSGGSKRRRDAGPTRPVRS